MIPVSTHFGGGGYMAEKEEKKTALNESSGGYMAVDRDEAFRANLELIKKISKITPRSANTNNSTKKTVQTEQKKQ